MLEFYFCLLFLQYNGQDIRWKHLVDLVKGEVGKNADQTTGLRRLHHLGYEHVFLNPSLRMRVYLAAQVCQNMLVRT